MASYDFWKLALQDPTKIGDHPALIIHDGEPQPGFYRMKDRDGGDMLPVAIWENRHGEIVAKVGAKMVEYPEDIWTWCCREPVSEQVYRGVIAGGSWPDSPPPKRAPAPKKKGEPEAAPASIGHNMPDDPFEALKLELESEAEIAKELLSKPVKDQDAADKIANFSKRVSALGKKADEMHAVEKRPILDAGKAVDDKFRDVRETAKEIATALKRHLDAFLAEQRRLEVERQRRAAEEAEAKRRAAEEAERKAMQEARSEDEARIAAERAERLKREAEQAELDAKARAVQAGRTGSKVSMRTFKSAKIVDYDQLIGALKTHEEVRSLIQTLADRSARAGIQLMGMEIISEERAV